MLYTYSPQEIQGELIDVDDQMLKILDDLEEHPRIYRRTPVQCVLEKGTSTDVTDLLGVSGNIPCETYLLYNYRPELLSLPHLSSYADKSDGMALHYVSKIDREDSKLEWWKELKSTNIN